MHEAGLKAERIPMVSDHVNGKNFSKDATYNETFK